MARDLLPAIKAEAERSSMFVHIQSALADWQDVVSNAEALGLHRDLLEAANPEIPLSYMDLLEQAAEEAPMDWLRAAKGGQPNEHILRRWDNEGFKKARSAGSAMRTLLSTYLNHKTSEHQDDVRQLDYLRDLLGKLQRFDVVITLNWDATVESVLAGQGRWTPVDGYGPRHDSVRVKSPVGVRLPRSEITILKLHGSVGWKVDDLLPDQVYLSNAYLLQCLSFRAGAETVFLQESGDHHQPHIRAMQSGRSKGKITVNGVLWSGLPSLEALPDLLVIRSYVKRIAHGSHMREIWLRADKALRRATEVEIWGYGLPESDGEVRLLLTNLRTRLDNDTVRVRVHDPSGDARDRWRDLLGRKARIDRRALRQKHHR